MSAETEIKPAEGVDAAAESDGFLSKSSDQVIDLKRRLAESERRYEQLKTLARQALQEFEDLKTKCNDNYEQCVEERRAHDVTRQDKKTLQDELTKLKETTQRAFEEYGEFQDKLDLEKDLRNKAEEYAQEVLQDNRKLIEQLKEAGATIPAGSHQSAAAMDDDDEPSKKDLKKGVVILHEQWEEAEQRSSRARDELEKLSAKHNHMKSEQERVTEDLAKEKEELEHLKELTRLALGEYQDMQKQLDTEREIRLAAEAHAAKQTQEANLVKRQSALILNTANENERVAAAFLQLEQVNDEVSGLRRIHAQEVSDLKEEISRLEQLQETKVLDEKLVLADKQCQLMEKKALDSQHKAEVADQRVKSLEEEVRALRDAISKAQSSSAAAAADPSSPPPAPIIAPPPMPPPPPPPPPPPMLQPISILVKKVKQDPASKKAKAEQKKDVRADAMQEMMSRIKSGNTGLRKSSARDDKRGKEPQQGDAMAQIAQLIKTKGTSHLRASTPIDRKPASPSSAVSSELQSLLSRRKQKAGDTTTDGLEPDDAFVSASTSPMPSDSSPSPDPAESSAAEAGEKSDTSAAGGDAATGGDATAEDTPATGAGDGAADL